MDINKIISHVKNNGGIIFETPNYLNIFGIRYDNNVNTFNDSLLVFWYDSNNLIHTFSPNKGFTTDPGFKSLKEPVNANGCAILKEGWYRRLWVKGLHHGKYSALVQYSPCTVYRDGDKDGELDMNSGKTETGMFGINLHRANEKQTSTVVENWSAGCQVLADPTEFASLMKLVDTAISSGQKYFSYFLANSKDLEEKKVKMTTLTEQLNKPKVEETSLVSGKMNLNEEGLNLIKSYEGCKLKAYKCPAGIWTIGYGNTYYEDGKKVKEGDSVSQERAEELFKNIVEKDFAVPVRKLIKSKITDNMFNALVSFSYNLGIGSLKSSTLLKKVNANPNDKTIANEFAKWVKSDGKVLPGLVKRRDAEAKLYFK